jgi:hypothetical protein
MNYPKIFKISKRTKMIYSRNIKIKFKNMNVLHQNSQLKLTSILDCLTSFKRNKIKLDKVLRKKLLFTIAC